MLAFSRQAQRAEHLRDEAFAAADRPKFFRRRRFEADPFFFEARHRRQAFDHCFAMFSDPWFFGEQGYIAIDERTALFLEKLDRVRNECCGWRILPLRIGRRKVLANITCADCAEKRVA
jgi:hypothetical protein